MKRFDKYESCPKCNGWTSYKYDAVDDRINIRCNACGWTDMRLPLDHTGVRNGREFSISEIRDFSEQTQY